MDHKRYVQIVISFIVLGLLLIITFNRIVDPAHLFSSSEYEKEIAVYLAKGKNVANISNYDERLLQKYYVNQLDNRKDVIVLGSSRSMMIGSEFFSNEGFFNNAVSGASLEDYLAIYQLYWEKGLKPTIVVLGLDPWLLNASNQQKRWISLRTEYNSSVQRLRLDNQSWLNNIVSPKYFELMSLDYTKSSIRKFIQSDTNKFECYPTDQTELNVPIKLADGALVYDTKFTSRSLTEVNADALKYLNSEPVYSLGNFTEIDQNLLLRLETFIKDLQKEGTHVVIYLPPYHPIVYDGLSASNNYSIIVDVENCYRNLAEHYGIKVIGSYNPYVVNFTAEDFDDGMHPKTSPIRKLFLMERN